MEHYQVLSRRRACDVLVVSYVLLTVHRAGEAASK